MNFNFVVVGDIGTAEGGLDKFEQRLPALLEYSPQIMLVCGGLVPASTDDNYRRTYAFLERVNKKYGLPIEVTPGATERLNGKLSDNFTYYFGEPNASFTLNGVRFITIDSSSGTVTEKETGFLDRHLSCPSFVFTHWPPKIGMWSFGGLDKGTEDLVEVLVNKSSFVLGAFFGNIKACSREQVVQDGMVSGVPAWVVGNGGTESYELSKFGYSRPGALGGLAVMVRGGEVTFEPVEARVGA